MNNRILKIKSLLATKKVDVILVSSPAHIIYLTGFDHFTPFEREAFLLITKNNNYIITDGRYSEAVRENIKGFTLLEISSQNPLTKLLHSIAKKHTIKTIAVEENDITVSEYKILVKSFKKRVPTIVKDLRIVKDDNEIKLIEKACMCGDKAFEYILGLLKPGVSEKEIAFELELFIRKQDGELSFPSIIAFGKNSSMPHHKTGITRLHKNSIVLLDFGVKMHNYCSDMTRTVFFGSAPKEFRKMYQTVLAAQQKAIDKLYDISIYHTLNTSGIDKIARNYITSNGYPTIPHSLGHGIGLEVHEPPRLSPRSKDILKPNMVFSVEPGIYVSGFGGVRIEDLIVLEKAGPRILTHAKRDLIEVK